MLAAHLSMTILEIRLVNLNPIGSSIGLAIDMLSKSVEVMDKDCLDCKAHCNSQDLPPLGVRERVRVPAVVPLGWLLGLVVLFFLTLTCDLNLESVWEQEQVQRPSVLVQWWWVLASSPS